jgi:hypothetical protein
MSRQSEDQSNTTVSPSASVAVHTTTAESPGPIVVGKAIRDCTTGLLFAGARGVVAPQPDTLRSAPRNTVGSFQWDRRGMSAFHCVQYEGNRTISIVQSRP